MKRTTLSAALEEARVADLDALLTLDDELRAVLPVYSLANDSARCAASDVDASYLPVPADPLDSRQR